MRVISTPEREADWYKRAPPNAAPLAIGFLAKLRAHLQCEVQYADALVGREEDVIRKRRAEMDAAFRELLRQLGRLADLDADGHWPAHLSAFAANTLDDYQRARALSTINPAWHASLTTQSEALFQILDMYTEQWERLAKGLGPKPTDGSHGMEVF